MSGLNVNTIGPRTTSNVDFSGISPPSYLGSPLIPASGGTFTGPVVLAGNAVNPLDAVPFQQLSGVVGGAQLLATDGYQVLPGGLILQWGTYTSDIPVAVTGSVSAVFVTFPLVFPNTCLNVSLTTLDLYNSYTADSWPALQSYSNTDFSILPQNTGNSGTSYVLKGFTWFAVGH